MAVGELHTKIIISMKDIVCSGALIYSLKSKMFLFLHRANGSRNNVWGLVGGTNEGTESPWQGLQREIEEEVGLVDIKKTIPLETFVSNDSKFHFHTYLCVIEDIFIPVLNKEHDGFAWVEFGKWPKPLHSGLQSTLNRKSNITKLKTVIEVIDLLD